MAAVALGVRVIHDRPVERDLAVRAAVEHGVAAAVGPPSGAGAGGNVGLRRVREEAALQVQARVADADDLFMALRGGIDIMDVCANVS